MSKITNFSDIKLEDISDAGSTENIINTTRPESSKVDVMTPPTLIRQKNKKVNIIPKRRNAVENVKILSSPKNLWDRLTGTYQYTKFDGYQIGILLCNVLIGILAIIVYFVHSRHIPDEYQEPWYFVIPKILLYISLFSLMGIQAKQAYARVGVYVVDPMGNNKI